MVCPPALFANPLTPLGVTYCDYGQEILICKPKAEMYYKAMMEAGVSDKQKCFFVDDSQGTPLTLLAFVILMTS